MSSRITESQRWLALSAVCFSMLLVAIDTTIVSIALPSIGRDLQIVGASLSWTMNAYTLALGGALLVSGRLGDLYGLRRLFMTGIAIFTLASLICGLAHTLITLLVGRALQGIGGAAVSAVGLSIVINLFADPTERARAVAINAFVQTGGAGAAQLLGGLLVGSFGWRAIFIMSLPVCAAAYIVCRTFLPRDDLQLEGLRQVDLAGAATGTLASTLGVYAVVNASSMGWQSIQTGGVLGMAGIFLLAFLAIEARAPAPLVPARVFRARNFVTANIVGALTTGGALASFVIVTFYLQNILGYDAFHAGIAFAPVTILAALLTRFAARMSIRFGVRIPLSAGILLSSAGLALLARAPLDATFVIDVLPAMLLLGLGGGLSTTPLVLAAMNEVPKEDSGLASGIFSACFLISGALGLAILVAAADVHSSNLRQSGAEPVAALNGGYHFALLLGATVAATAAAVSALAIRPSSGQGPAGSYNSEISLTR